MLIREDGVNLLFEAAADIGRFFDSKGWRYCIIGGLAVQRWGEPRTTQDVDLTLLTGFGNEETFAREILTHYAPRISTALEFSLRSRVLLITMPNGAAVDVAFGALSFEEEMLARAVNFEFAPGLILPMCTAEDLLVSKAFAGRPHDWSDIEGIIKRQGKRLDHPYIFRQLELLCALKEDDEIIPRVKGLLKVKK